MGRVLGEDQHVLLVRDPVSGSVITLNYRRPTSQERVAYQMSAFRLEGKEMEVLEVSVDRQCFHDFRLDVIDTAEGADAVLSGACGAGVKSLAARLPGKAVLPGLNAMFIGES